MEAEKIDPKLNPDWDAATQRELFFFENRIEKERKGGKGLEASIVWGAGQGVSEGKGTRSVARKAEGWRKKKTKRMDREREEQIVREAKLKVRAEEEERAKMRAEEEERARLQTHS